MTHYKLFNGVAYIDDRLEMTRSIISFKLRFEKGFWRNSTSDGKLTEPIPEIRTILDNRELSKKYKDVIVSVNQAEAGETACRSAHLGLMERLVTWQFAEAISNVRLALACLLVGVLVLTLRYH